MLNSKNISSWPKRKLGDLCIIDPSKKEINGIDLNTEVSFGMMADLGEHRRAFCPKETKVLREVTKGGYSYFKTNDLLLAKMTPCFENGKSGIACDLENDIGFGSTEFYVIRSNGEIDPNLLYYFISSEKFIDEGKYSLVGTTGRRRLLKQFIELFEIPLPPLGEQKQISSLLIAIETYIEQIEEQVKNLKSLWLSLINEFVSEKPAFGNLLEGKELKAFTYNEVAEKIMRRIDPVACGIERIVAGENLQSEDFKIRTWQKVGEGYLGPAFYVLFKPGDILYGSRRTYLKKVAMADFEGVCANTTYVIRAKENLLLQDLLKHIMLSERFTKYSIGVSKGSTNPYINWKDLDNFTFQIPDLQTQKEIAKVLDDIVNLIEDFKTQKSILKTLKQNLLNELLS